MHRIFPLVLVHGLFLPTLIIAQDQRSRDSHPAFAKAEARVQADIAVLNAESVEQTLERLSDVGMYFWPGPAGESLGGRLEFPLESKYGERDIQHILSNRRVLKAYQDLKALDKAAASRVVAQHLESALKEYERMYQRELEVTGPHYLRDTKLQGGPGYTIGNAKEPTIIGTRFKLLTLAFLAGNLELTDAAPAVSAVARRAAKQYDELRLAEKYHMMFRLGLLRAAGLYSRQALAVGLLGTSTNRDDRRVIWYRALMRTKELTRYDARTTPYDQAVIFGGVTVDFTVPVVVLKYLGELSDAEFEEIVAVAAAKER